jgi:hypothetical protein
MNKTAFVISIVLTTFVLMAVGGVVYAVRASQNSQVTPAAEPAVVEPAVADPAVADPLAVDPAVLQAWNEREAAYQKLIAEANARLAQAQQQLASQAQPAAPLVNNTTTLPQGTITPEQAAEVAANFLGQTNVYSVEVVALKGQDTYLVTFMSGDMVYVSMDGQIVGSASLKIGASGGGGGFAVPAGSIEPGQSNHGGDDHGGDDHGGDDHGGEGEGGSDD